MTYAKPSKNSDEVATIKLEEFTITITRNEDEEVVHQEQLSKDQAEEIASMVSRMAFDNALKA